jgi:alkylation response protein AidB-like acyl-CoA dehydrogenase
MQFDFSTEQILLRESVREFAESEIRPFISDWDEAQEFSVELVPKLAKLGLLGIQVDDAYGGAGMSTLDYCICIEELGRVCPAIALSVAAHNGLCVAHINKVGTQAQKLRLLPKLTGGTGLGAWALTEASSGSDAAKMRTTAVFNGSDWILNGSKVFCTHGRIGGVVVVIAVTDRTEGNNGITAFFVERGTEGMRAGKKENKLGMRASDTSEVIFDDCRIPPEQMLGIRGRGFQDTMQILDAGRIGIAALSVGLAEGAHEAARLYAGGRIAFDRPISSFQAIQWKLADDATRIDAARLLTYRAAWAADNGQPYTTLASMAKLFASEIAVTAADNCVQIHGGYGFIKDYPAEKFFRDVKLLTIGEGTSEIQRLVIARELLRQGSHSRNAVSMAFLQ